MRRLLLLACLAAVLACCVPAFAGTYTSALTTADDCEFLYHFYGREFLIWQPITVAGPDNYVSYYADPSIGYISNWYSFLEFSLPSLRTGETVESASLNIFVTSVAPGFWTLENQGNNVPEGGDFSGGGGPQFTSTGIGWLTMDVTGAVESDYASRYATGAFTMSPEAGTWVEFASPVGSWLCSTSPCGLEPYLSINDDGRRLPRACDVAADSGGHRLPGAPPAQARQGVTPPLRNIHPDLVL
jgi:hypothetical protein